MEFALPEITIYGTGLIVLIGILVEVVKSFGVSGRFLPLLSIVFGGILGWVATFIGDGGLTVVQGIVGGMLTGASVSGLYDLGKKTIAGK